MTPLRESILNLRARLNLPTLDQLERMMNNTKGRGTTPALVTAAVERGMVLVTHSEEWADQLREQTPSLKAKPFGTVGGAERVLIDNGVVWLLLREAQAIRRMAEALLNQLEQQKVGDK